MPPVALRLCRPLATTPGRANLDLRAGELCIPSLPRLASEIRLRTANRASLDATLAPVSGTFAATYDHAVWRGVGSLHRGDWQAAQTGDIETRAPHLDGRRQREEARAPWGRAARVAAHAGAHHAEMDALPNAAAASWAAARAVDTGAAVSHQDMLRHIRPASLSEWVIATDMAISDTGRWQDRHRYPRPSVGGGWQVSTQYARAWLGSHQVARPNPLQWLIPWGAGHAMYGWGGPWVPPVIQPPDTRCYRPVIGTAPLVFFERLSASRLYLIFRCPVQAQSIPRLRSYIVIHDIDVYRLPDMTPIHAARVSLSLDAESWSWGFSAALLGRNALDAVMPDVDGSPVTLAVSINGHTWHVLVEDWSEDRQHAQRGISVTGRGLTAWLGSPYELPANGVSTSDMTLQQLVEAHLPIGSGWTVNWDAPNWLIPAGAWTWQGRSPIQAMQEIAQGVGLVLIPALAEKSLTVQPRYPVMPWDYASATPALEIPDSAILRVGRRQAIASQANAVYVHGGEVGGMLARVRLTGSAGDRIAPTVQHSLITHSDAARSLGGRILASQYQQPETRRATLSLGGDYPLAGLGNLVAIDYGTSTDRGIVNGIDIEATRGDKGATVRQSLTLGEDTQNQWAKFRALIPGEPLLVGTVEMDHGDGTATVSMVGGGSMRVRGSGSIGQSVYVRAGRIEGQAPTMQALEIEV